ncbi:hypothetical protein BKA63DRAFT_387218, partial [Paraphoma chrysanthemicola]
ISARGKPCKCSKVKNPGLYCGWCWVDGQRAVREGYNTEDVFWCNTQGGCENLGIRTSCKNAKGPCDGRN